MSTKRPLLWENDPTLVTLSKKAQARVREATFQTLKKQGVTAASIRDKETAKDYAAWLADQPQQ